MKKLISRLNRTVFDVAAGPTLLLAVGVPIVIVLAVVAAIVLAIVFIVKAVKKNRKAGALSQKEGPAKPKA